MKKKAKQVKNAVFGGAMLLQAAPLLSPAGRTVPALTNTATGFVGIGIASFVSDVALDMILGKSHVKKRKTNRR